MNLHRLVKVSIAAIILTLPLFGCGEDIAQFTPKGATKHSISGSVVSGAPLSGAAINLSGDADRTTTTDSTGAYAFYDLADGSYVITPALAGYISLPTSTLITVNGADVTNANFTATVIPAFTYSISGFVSGAVLQGVSITLTGSANAATTTDASGSYTFTGVANGAYTLTPALAGYIFDPASTAVTVNGSNVTGTNFTATASAPTYRISGTVSGAVLQGVTITLAGDTNSTATTDASGNYAFTGLVAGSYTVTPVLAGYSFVSAKTAVTLSNADVAAINFAAMTNAGPLFSISGRLTGIVQQGVKVNLVGTTCATTTTDAGGNYTFTGLPAGSYSVIPVTWITCSYIAAPAMLPATVSNADVTNINFAISAGNSCGGVGTVVTPTNISGMVSGAVQQGVTMLLTGSICKTTTTDGSGNFTFSDYFTGGNFTVTAALVGHTFSPANRSVTVPSLGMSAVNFTAY